VEETETTTTTTTTTTGRRRRLEPDATLEVEALRALRPLHRLPISLRMRSRHGAEPPWTRNGGRGLIGDEPSPKALDEIWEMQATSREISKAAGRQSGLIVYKLGPKQSEVDHLRLSLTLLMRYHNRAFRYPILIAHDEELDGHTRDALGALAAGVSLRFARLRVELPSWLAPGSVPESVLGFPVAYRHMIRWKVGLLWQMPEVRDYEYIWSLDTDAFLLGPITYDVFGLMKARNATYGYVDVNVETPEVASGLADCMESFLRKQRPSLVPTMLDHFTSRSGPAGDRRWDGSKFYTNFQVARADFGRSRRFRALFEHIDRDGGIYRHRWGADPILFLAVTTLLDSEHVVHFDNVPYLHQHLVANLPDAPAPELVRPDGFEPPPLLEGGGSSADAAADAGGASIGRRVSRGTAALDASCAAAGSSMAGSGDECTPATAGKRVLLFAADASHVAAAIDALQRWQPPPACASPLLHIQICSPAALDLDATHAIATLLESLPPTVKSPALHVGRCDGPAIMGPDETANADRESQRSPGPSPRLPAAHLAASEALAALQSSQSDAVTGGSTAAAAATLLQLGVALDAGWHGLLLLCVDATDGRTMAAALAARLRGVRVLNVCDEPVSSDDGLAPPPPSPPPATSSSSTKGASASRAPPPTRSPNQREVDALSGLACAL
jgi:hypothetical protein